MATMMFATELSSVPIITIGEPGSRPLSVLPSTNPLSWRGTSSDKQTITLRARRGWQPLDAAKLWRFRELLWFLALRDIQVRYKQTLLGVFWAVLQPIALMIALTCLRRVMGMGGANDVIFVFAAILPWTFFAASVTGSTNSLVANAHMLRKIYFPRLLVPLAAVGAPLMDYAVSFCVLFLMMTLPWFAIAPTWQFALLPLLVLTTIIAALGVGVMLSALTVAYRDFRYVVTLLVQLWFFATPVIYSLDDIPERFRFVMWFNPMGGTIEAFRDAVMGTPIDYVAWAVSAQSAMLCFIVGLIYFCRAERRFADIV